LIKKKVMEIKSQWVLTWFLLANHLIFYSAIK
jgi:hypothetical protein